jgi:hypothetical protein
VDILNDLKLIGLNVRDISNRWHVKLLKKITYYPLQALKKG